MAYKPTDFLVSGHLVVDFDSDGIKGWRIEGGARHRDHPDMPEFRTQDVNGLTHPTLEEMLPKLVAVLGKGAARQANKEARPEEPEKL